VELARLLLESGADISVMDSVGATPLYSASLKGHTEVTKLPEKGADVTVANDNGWTPLNTATNQIFTYSPLAHSRSFRILCITRNLEEPSTNWKDLMLHGSIIEASLDNVPEYFALSYTWGNPSLSDKIFINGRALGITQSCADALRRMLKGRCERMIWVDSICINQAGMCLCIVNEFLCLLIF
jgi:hypothetical protein